jgi:hypothetical protein
MLHQHVVAKRLTDFNAEATRRTAGSKNPWKAAKSEDDLGTNLVRPLARTSRWRLAHKKSYAKTPPLPARAHLHGLSARTT